MNNHHQHRIKILFCPCLKSTRALWMILLKNNFMMLSLMLKFFTLFYKASSYFLWFGLSALQLIHWIERKFNTKWNKFSQEILRLRITIRKRLHILNAIHYLTGTMPQRKMPLQDQDMSGFYGLTILMLMKKYLRELFHKKLLLRQMTL